MAATMTSHLQFRRRVYAEELWVEGTPEPPQRDNHHYTRFLLPWLQRELEALLDHERDQIQLMATILLELLRVDLPLVEFTDTVRRYLGPRTSHFLHEYFAFMDSHLTMEEYDLIARYPLVIPSPQVTADDECQVVGVVKPRSERTPEIVDLSRDDDDDASAAEIGISSDHRICDPVLPASPERHSPSYSPPSPPYCPTSPGEWSSSPSYGSSSPSYWPTPNYCPTSPGEWSSSPSYGSSSPPYCPPSPPYTPYSPPPSSISPIHFSIPFRCPLSPTYSLTSPEPENAPTVTPPTSPSISSSTRYKTSRQFSEEGGTKKVKRQKLNKK